MILNHKSPSDLHHAQLCENQTGFSLPLDEDWLTTPEAAKFLKISEATLRNLTSNGRVPYYKWQRRNRYRKSELTQLLLSGKRGV